MKFYNTVLEAGKDVFKGAPFSYRSLKLTSMGGLQMAKEQPTGCEVSTFEGAFWIWPATVEKVA